MLDDAKNALLDGDLGQYQTLVEAARGVLAAAEAADADALTPTPTLTPLMPTTPAPRIQTTPAASPKATAANNQGTRTWRVFHGQRFGL